MSKNRFLDEYGFTDPVGIPSKTMNEIIRGKKMGTLRESAKNYEAKKTKNISELSEVNTEVEIKFKESEKSDGEGFSYNYIEVENEEYRVPNPVLEQLKTLIAEKPSMTKFKVTKKGEGKQTKYQVIQLD